MIDHLRARGHGKLIDAVLASPEVYLRGDQVDFARLSRAMNDHTAVLKLWWSDMLRDAREVA